MDKVDWWERASYDSSECSYEMQSEWNLLSHVRLFVTPWTVAHQALLFMEFSRQEHWSG